MNKSEYPSAEVLSKILLIQNMLGHLAKEKDIINFVSKGLIELPGIEDVKYVSTSDSDSDIGSNNNIFKVTIKGKTFGLFRLKYSNYSLSKPYIPYIQNLCFMIAIIFEEKYQREIVLKHQEDLETMVKDRTSLLTEEIKERIKTQELVILEKNRAEEYLRISEAIILELNTNGDIVNINEQGYKTLGYSRKSDLIGQNWFQIAIPKEFQIKIKEVFNKIISGKEEVTEYYENKIRTKTGDIKDISWHNTIKKNISGEIVGTLSSGIDITQNKKMLESLQKTEKLEAIGVLAGGIAHDFNNLLGGIFGFLDLALSETSPNSEAHKYLSKAVSVYNRAKDLTQQLLTFSKGGSPFLQTGSIVDLIRDSVSFALSGSKVRCSYNFPDNLWLTEFDENQMSQVFDNLTINAIHAMPEGGEINITAENTHIEDLNEFEIPSGKYINIYFKDYGLGIPEEILNKIFDPFMTTKKMGSGLGLATVYSIISKHGGAISVSSVLNKGTTFKIILPASGQIFGRSNKIEIDGIAQKYNGNILILDDEEFILDILKNMLIKLGFTVDHTKNGKEVLDLIESNKKYDAIILDLTVPNGLGGKDIIDQIREKYPSIPIFASSGYFNDPVMSEPKKFGFSACIPKPYRNKDLANVLAKYF